MKLETKEIRFPAPWGQIAAKTWGKEENQVIVCVHGTLDNAGTFDTLIPLLPENFYYVCIDMPGHGLSTHYEKCLPVTFHTLLLSIRVVCDYLSRESYIYMGHSLGARLLVTHCQIYPKRVSKLILIDSTYSIPKLPAVYLIELEESFNNLERSLKFKPDTKPLMSYDEAVKKVMIGRLSGMLTYETAEQLTRRMVEKVGDKYRFTYDPRLKTILEPPLDMAYIEELLKIRPLECPVMVISMQETERAFKYAKFAENYMSVIKEAVKCDIEGHHHMHHTNPETVAPHIGKFLLDQNKL